MFLPKLKVSFGEHGDDLAAKDPLDPVSMLRRVDRLEHKVGVLWWLLLLVGGVVSTVAAQQVSRWMAARALSSPPPFSSNAERMGSDRVSREDAGRP